MKSLWCWRCKMNVPMLEEDEYRLVVSKHGQKVASSGMADRIGRFHGPVLLEYERITGFHETNPNAVYHHRVSLYGPPCPNCTKPLSTPRAKFCAACGYRAGESNV
jgi:hypothetical protein